VEFDEKWPPVLLAHRDEFVEPLVEVLVDWLNGERDT
jgi:hypothetical protein